MKEYNEECANVRQWKEKRMNETEIAGVTLKRKGNEQKMSEKVKEQGEKRSTIEITGLKKEEKRK